MNKCRDCKPVLFDPQTNELVPKENPKMGMVKELWDRLAPEAKLAWHKVTCQKSRDPEDLDLARGFAGDIQAAIE